MPYPAQTPPQPPIQFPPAPAPPQPPSHPWSGRWAFALYGVLAGLVLGSLVFAGGSDDGTTATPAPTVTVTQTAPAKAAPTEAPTTEAPAPATYTPHKSDWVVGVKKKEQQCFGSAGCSVTVTIDPAYVGSDPLPDSGTVEVTYQLSGDTSGPVVGTFTVEGGQVSYDKETDLDTKSAKTKIAAKVTDVGYTE